MSPFFVVVLTVFLSIVILQFVLLRFILPQGLSRATRLAVSFAFAVGVNSIPFLYLLSGVTFDERPWWHRELVIFPYTIVLVTSAFSGLLFLVLWLVRLVAQKCRPAPDSQRRAFLATSARAVTGTSLAVAAYGCYGESRITEVSRQVLAYTKLHPDLRGFRLVHITDIHAGPLISVDAIAKVADKANALKPDMIVLTGDYINNNPAYIEGCVSVLDELTAPAGVFGVYGNHDYYTGIGPTRAAFSRTGISMLSDSRVAPKGLGGILNVIGAEDPVSGWSRDAEFRSSTKISRLVFPGQFNLLLSHRPGIFKICQDWGVALTLAGHTHGGQAIFPGIANRGLSLAGLFVTYTHGLYHSGSDPEVRMYVNRGIGTIIAPVRLFCRPEIAEITLVEK